MNSTVLSFAIWKEINQLENFQISPGWIVLNAIQFSCATIKKYVSALIHYFTSIKETISIFWNSLYILDELLIRRSDYFLLFIIMHKQLKQMNCHFLCTQCCETVFFTKKRSSSIHFHHSFNALFDILHLQLRFTNQSC